MPNDAPARLRTSSRVVREARRRANLSLEDATAQLNKRLKKEHAAAVSVEALRAWEAGLEEPTLLQGELLAQLYLIPFVALFQDALPPAHVTDFRRGPSGSTASMSYGTLERLSRFTSYYQVAKRVGAALSIAEDVKLPTRSLSSVQTDSDVEDLAIALRDAAGITDHVQRKWASDEQALSAWRDGIEMVGVFVFSQPMAVDECRGASRWDPGAPPALLLNSADTTSAQLFSLVHELGHLAFSTHKSNTNICDPSAPTNLREERLCNRLAGAALVPKSILLPELPDVIPSPRYQDWPAADRRWLRRLLNVSHGVIGIRLEQLGVVQDAGVSSLWRPRSKFVRAKNRPVWQRYRRYLGSRTIALSKQAVDSEAVSVSELSRLLDLKVSDVETLIG